MEKTFVFKNTDKVGAADADEDIYLDECFVDTGYLDILKDCSDPRSIVLGRTGTGKTALLKMLCEKNERTVKINPENLALQYLTNSTILPKLLDVGVDLDIIKKSGSWFEYDGEKIGQGNDAVRQYLKENPKISADIEKGIRTAVRQKSELPLNIGTEETEKTSSQDTAEE